MALLKQVDLGTAPTGKDGDPVRTGFVKHNANIKVLNTQATLSSTLITSPRPLIADDMGKRIKVSFATSDTLRWPAAASCAADQVIQIINVGPGTVTMAAAVGSGDVPAAVTVLKTGENVKYDTDGIHAWSVLSAPPLSTISSTLDAATEVLSSTTSLGTAIGRLAQGLAVTIAFEGDSITYGQDTSATGTGAPINSATQARSPNPFPERFGASLNLTYPKITIINRGYPGDTTIEGLSRWASAAPVNVCFLMYGHNDANNYAGYSHGSVSIPAYVTNMHGLIDRRLAQGSAVVVLGPPIVQDTNANTSIRPYVEAARKVAAERGVPFVDLQPFVDWMFGAIPLWTDGLHLSSAAYNEIGWHLAALFVNVKGAEQNRLSEHTRAYAQSGLIVGGDQTYVSVNAESGKYVKVIPGAVVTVSGYFEASVVPLLSLANPEGTASTALSFYYGGSVPFGIKVYRFVGTGAKYSQQFELQVIPRGYRSLTFRNDGATNVYIDSIKFRPASRNAAIVYSPINTGVWRKSALAGLSTARVASGTWSAFADTDNFLAGNWTIIADLTLLGDSISSNHGISLIADRKFSAASFLSNNQIFFFRSGAALLIRQFVGGSPTDKSYPGVFPATGGAVVEMIVAYLTSTNAITVSIGGAVVATLAAPSFTAGFPAISSTTGAVVKCSGMTLYSDMTL